MNRVKVFVRADGDSKTGLGHVIRSLSLAEMLKKEFDVTFIKRGINDSLNSEVRKYCNLVIIPEHVAHENEAAFLGREMLDYSSILVLDGYKFNSVYQKQIKVFIKALISIDDLVSDHFISDAIINHAEGVIASDYSKENYTKLFLGTKYSLVRKAFREATKAPLVSIIPKSNVLVCFGGADPNNYTLEFCKILDQLDVEKITVVTGPAYQGSDSLDIFRNNIRFEILSSLNEKDLCNSIKKSSLCIIPASTVSFEVCCVRKPFLLCYYVDNQVNIYNFLIDKNLGTPLGNLNNVSKEDIFQMINKVLKGEIDIAKQLEMQQLFFDDKIEERIIRIFKEFAV